MATPPWILLISCVVMVTPKSSGMHIAMMYRDINGLALESVDLDLGTGDIVVGAGGSLSKLSKDLSLQQTTFLKGHNSSSVAYSKGVAIDTVSSSVIACSNLYATCEVHSLNDVRNTLYVHNKAIVPKDQKLQNIILFVSSPYQVRFVNNFRKHTPREKMPVLSSRNPQNLSLVNSDEFGSSEKFALMGDLPGYYSVQYVNSFISGSYIYFISEQPNSVSKKSGVFVTKISRACLGDEHYRSFVEVQLDCVANQQMQYNRASTAHFDSRTQELYIGFTESSDDVTALCVFHLKDINNSMDKTIRNCYQGNGKLGPVHFHKGGSCVETSAPAELCGESTSSNVNPFIEGVVPVWQRPVIIIPSTQVTAIQTAQEGETKIVYLGTSNGVLKKVTLQKNGYGSVVREVTLDYGQAINRQMFLDQSGEYLYAMTKSKLMKIAIDHCTERTSCQACTASLDSVCGWCVLENRCSRESRCRAAGISPRWLPARNGVCAGMKDVSPTMLSYKYMDENSNGEISFKLDKVQVTDPSLVDLHCSFAIRGTKEHTVAMVQGDRITCSLPPGAKLPRLPVGVVRPVGDHSKMEVEFQVLGRTIVKRDWLLNDCRVNQNCTSCTESSGGCKWCHVLGMCVDEAGSMCPNQTAAAIKSSSSCPRLVVSAQETDILVHSGQFKSVAVRVANIQSDQMDNVHCMFTLPTSVEITAGKISSSNLICEALKFEFNDTQLPIVTAQFAVTSGAKSILLDNPQRIKVQIYKCGPMVTNCGQCLSMDPGYDCGWCTADNPDGNQECSLQSVCPKGKWLDRTGYCPNPQILRFNPLAGPVQGKSNISVTGLNLGKSYSDLEVTVAGRPCIVHAQHYESSQRFECEVVGSQKATDGVIEVKVNKQYTTTSDRAFMFVEPSVTGLSPKQGPMSGGTTLFIYGNFMNAGTLTTVDIGGSPCAYLRANQTMLECVTSQQTSNDNEVELSFGNLMKLVPEKFTYEKDPLINKIEPKNTILSGGTSLTAIGNQMQLIQKPQFFVDLNGNKVITNCVLQPLTSWLVCKTPMLKFPGENITETSPREVQYGFNLDGVTTYRNISADPSFGPLLYYPDPDIKKFPPVGSDEEKKYDKNNRLVIKGNFRRISPIIEDVKVTVGGASCKQLQASDDALSCQAPNEPVAVDGSGKAVVFLHIGNMQTEVGYLSYVDDGEEEKPIAVGIILGVVLPIIAIILLLTICVIRRHRKHKPSEDYIPDVWKDTEGKHDEDEEIGMNHLVKADMNGSIPDDKDTAPYIEELLGKIDDDAIRHNVGQFIISRKRLDIGDLLGKGNFGVTYKATYSKTDEENSTDVAVKSLQGTQADSDSVAAFLQTVTVYKDLQHPGVAPIVGVCITHSNDPMIVTPYAQNGDLKSYVRDSNRNVTVLELLDFGNQMAEAMAYLESVHIVHGNLALRNCLITDQKMVQVCDYGLTKELYNKETYFKEDDKLKVLVKWAAPEAVETVSFTSKSDVWSCGVSLWELLTRGVTPYPDVENSNLLEYLEKGNRMKKPRQCPEAIYELMLKCWNKDPEVRPTFRQIADEIHSSTTTGGDDQSLGDTTPLQKTINVDQAGELV